MAKFHITTISKLCTSVIDRIWMRRYVSLMSTLKELPCIFVISVSWPPWARRP